MNLRKIMLSTTVATVLVGILAVSLVVLFNKLQDVQASQKQLKQTVAELSEKHSVLRHNFETAQSAQRVVVDAEDGFVYIPDLKLRIPRTAVSQSLAYTLRTDKTGEFSGEADIRSVAYRYPEKMLVKDCGSLVRIKFEATPNPYSPHEKPTSVLLTDGRTLQIYEFVHEDECTESWNSSISPAPVAEAFRTAESY